MPIDKHLISGYNELIFLLLLKIFVYAYIIKPHAIVDIIIHTISFFTANCFTAATGIAEQTAATAIQHIDILSTSIYH